MQPATQQHRRINRKTMSMVALKENTNRRMRQLKAAMDDYTLLPQFIRLIDYLCAENLFRNALECLKTLNRELLRKQFELP